MNRLDVPNRFYKMGFEEGKKQGAVEELRKEKRFIEGIINLDLKNSKYHVSPQLCKYIESEYLAIKKLIKELEGKE